MKTVILVSALFVIVGSLCGLAVAAAPDAAGGAAIVSINGSAFTPDKIIIKAGTEVLWKNNESAPHTVTADDGSFDSGTLNQGDVFRRTFPAPGSFTYSCGNHAWMSGTVVVE